jgi:pimeloyl-ACP methyl ester carboxylesterase
MSAPCEPWREDVEGLRLTHWGSTGPTILLIHGYGYDARVWGGFAPHLAVDTHVIAVEWDSQGAPLRWGDIFAQVRKVTSAVSSVDLVVAHAEGAAAAVNLALEGFCPALLQFSPVPDLWPPEDRRDHRIPKDLPPADDPLEAEFFSALGQVAEHPEAGVDRIIEVTTELYTPDVQYEEDAALIRPIVDRQFRTIAEQPVLELSEPYWEISILKSQVRWLAWGRFGVIGLVDRWFGSS